MPRARVCDSERARGSERGESASERERERERERELSMCVSCRKVFELLCCSLAT